MHRYDNRPWSQGEGSRDEPTSSARTTPAGAAHRVCQALDVRVEGQLSKLRGKPWAVVKMIYMTAGDGKNYEMACIDLEGLPISLATLDPGRVKPALREKLIVYQKGVARAVRDFFFGAAPKVPVPARPEPLVPVVGAPGSKPQLAGDAPKFHPVVVEHLNEHDRQIGAPGSPRQRSGAWRCRRCPRATRGRSRRRRAVSPPARRVPLSAGSPVPRDPPAGTCRRPLRCRRIAQRGARFASPHRWRGKFEMMKLPSVGRWSTAAPPHGRAALGVQEGGEHGASVPER